MDAILARLAAWLPQQRWSSGSSELPSLRLLAEHPLTSREPDVRVRILVVADDTTIPATAYQVPVVERPAGPTDMPGLIAVTDGVALIDGPHDQAFRTALLHLVSPGATAPGEVLRGEQSNTSIVYRPADGHPLICKLFRRPTAGTNPDIELQTALAGAGSRHVPAVIGSYDASWQNPSDPRERERGALAFAQELFPDVEDAWRVALRSARAGGDFADDADALGRATAQVHADLARLFGTRAADRAARHTIVDGWQHRLAIALAEVPQLRTHEAAIRARYDAAASESWPALQRIHGDYHLGQVIQVPGRGWVLLDFEGEPLRPASERRDLDLAPRDIAGMLRSFDYVAGSLATGPGPSRTPGVADAPPGISPAHWAARARAAFLEGYDRVTGTMPGAALLAALELDKAVYETVYESRHRSDWLSIPLGAVDRLVAG